MKTITLPGSKSLTNRDYILACLANGESKLSGVLKSDDTIYMQKALQKLGFDIQEKNKNIVVKGGINNFKNKNEEIFLGQSGTCIRFLTAFAVLNKSGRIKLYGDDRLNKRPIKDLVDAVKQMGIEIDSNNGFPPVIIKGGEIKNNKIKMNGTCSSQFFTAVLHIAPLVKGGMEIEVIGDLVSKPYIDLTINEMKKFGVNVENYDYKKFIVKEQTYYPLDLEIEGDASALSYMANFTAMHGGELKITNIGKNTKQGDYKYLDMLKKFFNFDYETDGKTTVLRGKKITNLIETEDIIIDFESMPDVSLSFMAMSIFLKGKTKLVGLQTLNLKESKRIDAMGTELKKLGVEVEYDDKSITIGEYDFSKKIKNIDIETYNDHRIAMVFGTLNTFIGGLNILNPSCVNKTYPKFWDDLLYLMNV